MIRHAWRFYYALVLVIKVVYGSIVLRASHLNWALVRDWHQRLKIQCLMVPFPCFTPERACLSRSFRWHYMGSVCVDFTVYDL
ncbi:TPA: DUF3265 domain-containing protein [Vibrio parahaemolyticus]|nr:DUF3265 domain-containing protein [Vibrio parahaemolyticus]